MAGRRIDSRSYYSTYFGHDPELLTSLHDGLRGDDPQHPRPCIFLAGDSSLDNKVWFEDRSEAVNGYENHLVPPTMKHDVCFWVNAELQRRGIDAFCLNTAVEATALNSRPFCCILQQEEVIRRCITPRDTLVVSIGGNDLALMPVLATLLNIIPLICLTPQACIERCACACPPNIAYRLSCDCGCVGCGLPGCLVSPFGWPPGLAYFVDLFGNRVQEYILRVLGGRRPQKVVCCMIYFLDVHGRGGWADGFLGCMGYNCAPSRLQSAIRKVFELATKRIRIPGVEVIAFPLFEHLDGSDTRDYIERVEPSPRGGRKMARALIDTLYGALPYVGEHDEYSSGSEQYGAGPGDGLVMRRHQTREDR